MIHLAILIQYCSVTDRQTDRQAKTLYQYHLTVLNS